jgi:hypothetical protein
VKVKVPSSNVGVRAAQLNCRDCQRSSGAPFASGVVVTASDLHVTGAPATYAVRGSSGGLTVRSFLLNMQVSAFHAK